MKNLVKGLVIIGCTLMLAACGANNGSTLEAAQTIMAGMTEGDSEKIEAVNRSDEWSFPTDHMIVLANENGLIDSNVKDMTFKEGEDNTVEVMYMDGDGEEKTWTLEFVEEEDGYYFVGLY